MHPYTHEINFGEIILWVAYKMANTQQIIDMDPCEINLGVTITYQYFDSRNRIWIVKNKPKKIDMSNIYEDFV